MAELHGRVRRVRHRAVTLLGAIAAVASISASTSVDAQSVPPPLEHLELGLASDHASERSAALDAYAALDAADTAAVATRLSQLRRHPSDPLETTRVLAAFRHAVGSRRADDAIDLAPGIAPTLAAARDPLTVRVAAAIALERAAERVASTESLGCIVELAAWGGDGMRLEAQRIAMRVGPRLAPIVIAARSSDEREVRQWAEWAGTRLGLDEPGRFVAGLDAGLLPDVLRAFARAHVLAAVPVAISFIDARRSSTRAAAREALTIYGQNSIWVARDAYRIRTGEAADLDWGWRATLEALFSVADAGEEARVEADLRRASAALDARDRAEAGRALEAVLMVVPATTSTAPGSGLLRLAELDLDADDTEAADLHLRVAARLPVPASEEQRREALALSTAADARVREGVLDADAYTRAFATDPSCERCAQLHARFEEPGAEPADGAPWHLWLAAAAFLVLALLVWPTRDMRERAPTADQSADATLPG